MIVWSTFQADNINIQSETSFLWGFEFSPVTGDPSSLTVNSTRYWEPAEGLASCQVVFEGKPVNPVCSTELVGKWGLDGSQYNPGENQHLFIVELMDGCTPISRDEFEFTLTWTP